MHFIAFDDDIISVEHLMSASINHDSSPKVVRLSFEHQHDLIFEFDSADIAKQKLAELTRQLTALFEPPIR